MQAIAVVADAFAPFHREVLDGLTPHFRAAGFGTLAVTGRDVQSDRLIDDGQDTRVSSTGINVKGAIVVCGATPPHLSSVEIAEYVAELTDGPVVSFGIVLPGVPSVTIDWEPTIAELMAHMVADPARQRFVYLSGFAGDPHSTMREVGFRAGLATAGRQIDEELVINGHYSTADAFNATGRLIEDGHRFDAVVAANDDMAIGAIAALTRHGLRVPKDVIVAGFDNSDAAFTCEPPLTSVRLDTQRLTAEAAELLLGAIETGEPLAPTTEIQIPSGLAVRDSTSSSSSVSENTNSGVLGRLRDSWEADRAPKHFNLDRLGETIVEALSSDGSMLTVARTALHDQLTDPGSVGFTSADLAWIRHLTFLIHRVTAEGVHGTTEAGRQAVRGELAAVEEALRPVARLLELELQTHRELRERLLMRIASCSDSAALWETLRAGLHSLGLTNAWVAVNDGPSSSSRSAMRLMFSLADQDLSEPDVFLRSEVVPSRFRSTIESGFFALVPLRAGESDIGHLVIEPTGEHLLELETIASGIAQILRHVHQVDDLEHQASRLRLANETLDNLARHDSLTGLANRKLFLERLRSETVSLQSGEQVSLLFLDLDGLKRINDTYGHEAGDQLLCIVADRVSELLDDEATFARLGGDEFTIILRHPTGSAVPDEIARQVLLAIASPCRLLDHVVTVSVSGGIARFPDHARTPDELVRHADAAMYVAKAQGRNRFAHFIDPSSVDSAGTP